MVRIGGVSCAVVAALVSFAGSAWAQAFDPAAAQSLFDEGTRLMKEKNFAAACPKLAESQKLDPAGGTVIALALCHEGEGKTATAWAEFNQALSDARRDRRADRETAAAEHIRALEPRLSHVRIVVPNAAPGLEVKRDGLTVGSAQWSVAVAVDPGAHVIEATAPNKQRWSTSVTLQEEGKTIDVVVPALADAAPVPAPAATPPKTEAPAKTTPAPRELPESSSQRTWGLVVGGAGLVGVGVGAIFGARASSKWSDAKRDCPGNVCPSVAAQQAGKDAGKAADVSTALFVIGGLALAGGAVLFFTAPDDAPKPRARVRIAPWAGPEGGGAVVGGVL